MLVDRIVAISLIVIVVLLARVNSFWPFDKYLYVHEAEEEMKAKELIVSKGYPCEEHDVVTKDGYILTLQRIPYGKTDSADKSCTRPVVFLQHGLLASATNWLTNLEKESFAYLLANAGFDVWLGNMRGNSYSSRHQTYSVDDHEFWKFSWDEMAEFDLPAMINYVVNVTNQQQLFYVGHSQGTMTAFAQFSTDQQLATKIKHMFALAPVAQVGHARGVFRIVVDVFGVAAKTLLTFFGFDRFMPSGLIIKFTANYLCGSLFTNPLCSNILFLISGPDSNQLNKTRIPIYLAHTPDGSSAQNIYHYMQMLNSDLCQKYDYGNIYENYDHYGQESAPIYPLEQFMVPADIYAGDKDLLANPQDVAELMDLWINKEQKTNIKFIHLEDFNHMDFIWGIRAAKEVYQPVIEKMKAIEKESQTNLC